MFSKPINSSRNLLDVFSTRWSGIAFDSSRAPTRNELELILEAARWAPSCFNDQPWRFIVCTKVEQPQAWQNVYDSLLELNQRWCKQVPVFILVVASRKFNHNGEDNPWSQYDSGAASVSLCLQAASMGLMTHQMAGFSASQLQSEFSIPEAFLPISVIAAGYQLPKESIDTAVMERESAPRVRRSADSVRSYGCWGGEF